MDHNTVPDSCTRDDLRVVDGIHVALPVPEARWWYTRIELIAGTRERLAFGRRWPATEAALAGIAAERAAGAAAGGAQ
jgi:hypothetical protein